MLGAGPFEAFRPTKLSKSMLILPALLHVDPIAIDFLVGSGAALLLAELLIADELEGRRMLSARSRRARNKLINVRSKSIYVSIIKNYFSRIQI